MFDVPNTDMDLLLIGKTHFIIIDININVNLVFSWNYIYTSLISAIVKTKMYIFSICTERSTYCNLVVQSGTVDWRFLKNMKLLETWCLWWFTKKTKDWGDICNFIFTTSHLPYKQDNTSYAMCIRSVHCIRTCHNEYLIYANFLIQCPYYFPSSTKMVMHLQTLCSFLFLFYFCYRNLAFEYFFWYCPLSTQYQFLHYSGLFVTLYVVTTQTHSWHIITFKWFLLPACYV